MNKLLTISLCSVALFFGCFSVTIADSFEEGFQAAIAGDYPTAMKIFKQFSEQGDAYAQSNLGVMYGLGEGAPKDKIIAYMWYYLANETSQRYGKSNLRLLSKEMTSKELRIAQELSQKCLNSDYKNCESALPNFLHRKFNLSSEEKD